MLLNSATPHAGALADVDTVHNYYERPVLTQIPKLSERAKSDPDYFADVACVSLNRLPPRYIRHDVDMSFFMSPTELQEINEKIDQAIREAIAYVDIREGERT